MSKILRLDLLVLYVLQQVSWIGIICLLCLASSCSSLKVPAKKTSILIRDLHNDNVPLVNVNIHLLDPQGNTLAPTATTNQLGYAEFVWKKVAGSFPVRPDLSGHAFVCVYSFQDTEGNFTVRDTFQINKYLPFLDLYLDTNRSPSLSTPAIPRKRVADMHYHVSMRTHNLYGDLLYPDEETKLDISDNLNLYKDYSKLKVLYKGRWRKAYLGPIDFNKVNSSKKWRGEEIK